MTDSDLSTLQALILVAYRLFDDDVFKQFVSVPTEDIIPFLSAEAGELRSAAIAVLRETEEIAPGSRTEIVPLLENIILHDKDEEVRFSAIWGLTYFKTEAAVEAAIKALIWDDENEFEAFCTLDHHPRETVLRILKVHLTDDEPRVRFQCATWLVEFDGFEKYVERIDHPDSTVRLLAVCAARDSRQVSLDELEARYKQESDAAVRAACIETMGRLLNRRVAAPFIPALSDPAAVVRCEAFIAMWDAPGSEMDSPEAHQTLEKLIMDKDPFLRRQAVQSAGFSNARNCIPLLITLLRDPDERVSFEVYQALGHLRATEAIPVLVSLARQGGEYAASSIDTLGMIRDDRVAPLLIELLQNRTYPHRMAIPWSLARLKGNRIFPVLRAVLDDTSEDDTMRGRAALGLEITGAPEAFDILLAYVKDPTISPALLHDIVWALRNLRDTRAEPYLIELLLHPDAKVRDMTENALGYLATPAGFARLKEILNSIDKENSPEFYSGVSSMLAQYNRKFGSIS